jgi:hypothetical protein
MLLYTLEGSTSYAERRRGPSPSPRALILKLNYYDKCLEIGPLSMGFYFRPTRELLTSEALQQVSGDLESVSF